MWYYVHIMNTAKHEKNGEKPLTPADLRKQLKEIDGVGYGNVYGGTVLNLDLSAPSLTPYTAPDGTYGEIVWQRLQAVITPPNGKPFGLVEARVEGKPRYMLTEIASEDGTSARIAAVLSSDNAPRAVGRDEQGRPWESVVIGDDLGTGVAIKHTGPGVTEVIGAENTNLQNSGYEPVPPQMWAPTDKSVFNEGFN